MGTNWDGAENSQFPGPEVYLWNSCRDLIVCISQAPQAHFMQIGVKNGCAEYVHSRKTKGQL